MASPSVCCYPVPGKQKSHDICAAFAQGCGGWLGDHRRFDPSAAAFFYGVVDEMKGCWDGVGRNGYFYSDNSYFDRGREHYYRVTRNGFQVSACIRPDFSRLSDLGVKPKRWAARGSHIVLVEQSAPFLRLSGFRGDWISAVRAALAKVTDRPLRIRRWNRDKGGAAKTLHADLEDAWALVTHMSAAANEALVAGIPVVTTGFCAATPLATPLYAIEEPRHYDIDTVRAWAAGLAASQWTLDEFRNGTCWKAFNG